MLVTFTCKTHNDVTMFGDNAQSLIKMMEYTTDIPGAIVAEDVESALANLEKNLVIAAAEQRAVQEQQQAIENDDENEKEPEISISVRAVPLIELLKAAMLAKSYVMWQ
ncbi:DUF1840 domain-containing protein [Photobacterium piscicola]|uniref:DUF1840 domain-containing protein n=1 Tax=Photobacterium piscicola TaxID=1378299 RepID=UPI002E185B3A|nr:DUF1840 domain-containing protein [Photobacterium piscicola]